ncbi:MAG: YebC/PmpR family DNA-binding transcriptional regulator [Elusimicrobia bacterium]|nr:YebC/PmpR family DNA-binding transcriptional regulator [Elusimicrobiota bacterium]
MSGHSKWSSIKHKKGKEDAKKGKIFSRIVKEIVVAAKAGGGDPATNARLRLAVDKANEANMPKDNIEKAIKRGIGELPGVSYIEMVYEGYGPGGIAMLVNITTDNKNRTASEMRKLFADYGGNLGETGCVNWMFRKKGLISVLKSKISEDELMEKALELDIEDIDTSDNEYYEITTAPEKFNIVKEAVKKIVEIENSELTMMPNTYIKLTGREASSMLKLMDALEDNDDVQAIFANFDIDSKEIEKFQ